MVAEVICKSNCLPCGRRAKWFSHYLSEFAFQIDIQPEFKDHKMDSSWKLAQIRSCQLSKFVHHIDKGIEARDIKVRNQFAVNWALILLSIESVHQIGLKFSGDTRVKKLLWMQNFELIWLLIVWTYSSNWHNPWKVAAKQLE